MLLRVIEADYINNYRIKLSFSNGETLVVDLENELEGEVFTPLKDKIFFKDFFISHNTIEWKNGADFAPEFLYELALSQKAALAEAA